MAFFECNFFSESLGMCVTANVIIPQPASRLIGMTGNGSADGCPVLYLLHGLSDDHSIWMRRTSIERYAASYGIAVVMPNVHRSFYSNFHDQKYSMRYWDYISEELPQIIGKFFKFSSRREDTFVAGLSMGGFGALKLGLNLPDKFAAVASLSGVTDLVMLAGQSEERFEDLQAIYGDVGKTVGTLNDLFYLSSRSAEEKTTLPEIFLACGTEDYIYEQNTKLRDHLNALGINFTYLDGPGNHNWEFWDEYIQKILAWLPIKCD